MSEKKVIHVKRVMGLMAVAAILVVGYSNCSQSGFKSQVFSSPFTQASTTPGTTVTTTTVTTTTLLVSETLRFPNPLPQVTQIAAGSQFQFLANVPVTWSLAPGSVGSIDPQTGIYTAPASITPHNQIAGCQLLPNDHIYNTRIDALPVLAADTTFLNTTVILPIGFEVSFPENDVDNSTPQQAMFFTYTPQNNGIFPSPVFPNLLGEGGYNNVSQTMQASNADHHVVMMNKQTCQASEMYQRYALTGGLNSQSGVQYGFDYKLNGGTDAAGMYLQPLAFRFSELRNCVDRGIPIQHAGRFTLSNGYINSQIRWPATAQTNEAPTGVPYGARARLRASYNISQMSPAAQCMATALKNYGIIMADGGDNFGIQTMADIESSVDALNAIGGYPAGELNVIRSTDFEVVDESSLEDLNTGSPTYKSGRVNPSNPYVVPADFATVIATTQSNTSVTASVPIALQAVTVGTADRSKYVMAGTPGIQLQGWVTGSSNPGLKWSLSPAVGSITAGGVYTAPATITQPTMTTITATSVADPHQSTFFNLNVMPGPAIRVMADNAVPGSASYLNNGVDYGPDASGKIWWGGRGAVGGTSRGIESSYYRGLCNYLGQCTWPSVTDIQRYYNQAGDQNDTIIRYSVPNGTYTITLMFGMFSAFSTGDYVFSIDVQGTVVASSIDMCTIIGSCTPYKPGNLTYTATVTDNNLYFALREMPTSKHPAVINAFSILKN